MSANKNAILIVPARGGSKRIPNKNLRPFLGRPIIEYPIKAGLESKLFAEAMISTDSPEIAKVAMQAGLKFPGFRSKKNSDDFASTADVLFEVLDLYAQQGREFEYFCCVYATAPFVTAARLNEAFSELKKTGADFAMPVVRYSYPIQRALTVSDGWVAMREPAHVQTRSQDLQPMYHDCGQFYFGRTQSLHQHKSFMLGKVVPLYTSELDMQDIDSEEDWRLAELKFQLQKRV